jgi:hypothetical protein
MRWEEGDDICNWRTWVVMLTPGRVGGDFVNATFQRTCSVFGDKITAKVDAGWQWMLVAPSKHVVVDLVVGILLVGCTPNIREGQGIRSHGYGCS